MDTQIPFDASIIIDSLLNSLGVFWGSLSNTYRILFGMGISIWFLFQIPRNLYHRFFPGIFMSEDELRWENRMRKRYNDSLALEEDLNARFSDGHESYDELVEHYDEADRTYNKYEGKDYYYVLEDYYEGGGI